LSADQRVDRQRGRTRLRTIRAINTSLDVSPIAEWAQHRHDPQRAQQISPAGPMNWQKFSIFTSATTPYGLSMKAEIAFADILETAQTRNPSSKYCSPRSGMSIHRVKSKFRPNTFFPILPKDCERVPTRPSQLQKVLRNRKDIATNVTKLGCGMQPRHMACEQNSTYDGVFPAEPCMFIASRSTS
jgi:hypothetical protein